MKVYLLSFDIVYNYEGVDTTNIGVFSTPDKAKKKLADIAGKSEASFDGLEAITPTRLRMDRTVKPYSNSDGPQNDIDREYGLNNGDYYTFHIEEFEVDNE